MPKILWNKDYETGHETLDHQHRVLIETLNELIAAAKENHTEKDAILVIKICLDLLSDYVKYHFREEERLMKEINYFDIMPHFLAHQNFECMLSLYYDRHKSGENILNEFISFLRSWITSHIKNVDMDLAKALSKSTSVYANEYIQKS